jgi:hypothetical protein
MLQAIAEEVWSAGAAGSAPALQLLQLAL